MKKIVAGILAHVDAGKTTLSEALLFESGTIRKTGRVDNGDAFLDTNAYEKERGITIYSKTARLNLNDTELILLDTPGHVDFSQETERAISVMDVAILLINASDGVQSHTRTLFKILKEHNKPIITFVNKMDLPDTDKKTVMESLKNNLSGDFVDFSEDGTDSFYETIATVSDEALSQYMETGKVEESLISEAFRQRKVFPVYFGSALRLQGVKDFLQGFEKYASPSEIKTQLSGIVYKITKDAGNVRETHIKLTGGSLKVKDLLNSEKINDLRLYSGNKYASVKEVFAGDVCAITGVTNLKSGDVFGDEPPIPMKILEPVLNYTLKFADSDDMVKMHRYLQELEEEDPTLGVEYNEATRELSLKLMGEVQTEILKKTMLDRFGVNVSFGPGKVLYKETIEDVVEGVGHFEPLRHYAEVHLLMEPGERGSGLIFESSVSENDLKRNWQQLILTHLKEKMHKGVLTGAPITDMKITLVSGKAHLKHTEGGDFRQATYRAVRQGLMQATSHLLEPFYFYEIEVPENQVGKVLTDIDRMAGTGEVMENAGGIARIVGRAPVSTLNGYAKDLAAFTKGLGRVSFTNAGYDLCHNEDEVVAAKQYNPEADLKNSPDSVFCMHGAGTVIPWHEVFDYMHLPLLGMEKNESSGYREVINKGGTKREELFLSTEEIDDIIHNAGAANINKKKLAGKAFDINERLRPKEVDLKAPEYKGTKPKEQFMLIDGYNVVHAWPELHDLSNVNLNGAAGRLMDIVSNYAAITGKQVILVFDAYKVPGHAEEEIDYHNIKVVYTKYAETADHYIERYAHVNGGKKDRVITVVTSDGVEQVIIRGEGCVLLSSRDFMDEVKRASESIEKYYKTNV